MTRCPFCDHKNPTGATHCAECKAELFDPDAAAADAGAGAPSAEANSLDGRVLALVRDGRKIQAIKLYRDITGAGLKEAKDAVEALERDGALSSKRAGAAGAGVDKAEILELLRKEGETFAGWLDTLTPEFLGEMVTVADNTGTKSRFEQLLGAKEHEMHHRGQLMLIERQLGMVPHLTRQAEERMTQMLAART
jgi:ribosomal protein L7/L12